MFDLGWMELLIIGIVALIVVGPKDLPMMFKTVGNFVGKAKKMARDFQMTMNAAASETGLKETSDILKKIDDVKNPLPKIRGGEKSNYGKAKYSIPMFLNAGYEIVMDEYQMILKKS